MQWLQPSPGATMVLEEILPAGYMLNMLREAKPSVAALASSSTDAPARARPAAMCLAPLRPSFASENSFAPLSEDEEYLALGIDPAAAPKPEKCAPRNGRCRAPR